MNTRTLQEQPSLRMNVLEPPQSGKPFPLIAFGVNTTFALNHLLGHTLIGLTGKGYRVVAIAPDAERNFMHGRECPGLLLKSIDMTREISPFAGLRVLWKLLILFLRLRPGITNLSTPKMALLGGIAAVLTRVPRRIY